MALTLRSRAEEIKAKFRSSVSGILDSLEDLSTVAEKARSARNIVTPLGWAVVVVGVVAWIFGWWLGWLELMIVAAACLLLFIMGLGFVVGRSVLHIAIELDPLRVTAGDPSACQLVVANPGTRRSASVQIEVPVGARFATFDVRALGPDQSVEEVFVVATDRRGIIPVGPATSVRSDPLGLFQRQASASEAMELIVHPHTVLPEPFGSGMLRDLEGLTTKDLSTSDLAFHALREYAPGDDRRQIHWRSSAKAGQLLVRQYLDTRRSTLCVLVDAQDSGYAGPDEFELALEIAGSVALRACRDGLSTVLSAGGKASVGHLSHVHLDVLARAEMSSKAADLWTQAGRASVQGGAASIAVVISGSLRPAQEFDRASSRFAPEVRMVGLRVVPGESPRFSIASRGVTAQLSSLDQLPGLLRRGVTT